MSLGSKLIKLRKKAGFSQEEMGEKLGVSRQTISKWETDQTVPELEKIKGLSQLYKVSCDCLVNENKTEEELSKFEMAEGEIDWTKIWSKEYPILETYPQMKGIEPYYQKIEEAYDRFKETFGSTDQDTVLILKDILYKKYQKSKNK